MSIAVCFDENYTLNGAITLYSASRNIRDGIKIKAYIIDGGVKEKTKKKVKRIESNDLEIIWLNPDLSIFDNLPLSSWTTRVAHARLLLPDLIKEEKILYLDSDMLVVDDIYKLWEIPFNKNIILAWQDSKYPYVNKKKNYKILTGAGMKLVAPYFNSGLLLIDINKWKKGNILNKYIKLLKSIGKSFTHRNQDALNIILENKWKKLNNDWQVATTTFLSNKKEDIELSKKAKIIHFTSIPPGKPGCRHPQKKIFYNYVYDSEYFSKQEYFWWRFVLLIKEIFYKLISKIRFALKRLF